MGLKRISHDRNLVPLVCSDRSIYTVTGSDRFGGVERMNLVCEAASFILRITCAVGTLRKETSANLGRSHGEFSLV